MSQSIHEGLRDQTKQPVSTAMTKMQQTAIKIDAEYLVQASTSISDRKIAIGSNKFVDPR